MKARKISQLQFRAFIIIVIVFCITKLSYLFFIERPTTQENIDFIIKKDVAHLTIRAKNILNQLEAINHDYASSDYAYQFIQSENSNYLKEYLPENKLNVLQLDAIIFINKNLESVYQKRNVDNKGRRLNFGVDDFTLFPKYKKLFMKHSAVESGIMDTLSGPAFFSLSAVTKSDGSGEHKGALLFLRLINKKILDNMSEGTETELALSEVSDDIDISRLDDWLELNTFLPLTAETHRLVKQYDGTPLKLLTIEHTNIEMPPWIGQRTLIYLVVLLVLLFMLKVFAEKYITQSIIELAQQIKRIEYNKNLKLLNENTAIIEVNEIAKNFNVLALSVQAHSEKMTEQLYIDSLTQVSNRRAFEAHLQKQIQLYRRYGIGFTLVMADIDYFKRYNDSLGHPAGDDALYKVAQLLNMHFKRSNDMCARYGGEEFIMLFSDMKEQFIEAKLTALINHINEEAYPHPDSPIAKHITLSLGACVVSGEETNKDDVSPGELIEAADKALYEAKHNGRNQLVINKHNRPS